MKNACEARILPPVPLIASKGRVVDDGVIFLMDRVARELNADLCEPRYEVTVDKDGGWDDSGERLPEGQWRVYLRGRWIDSLLQQEHLLNFLGHVAELADGLPAQSLTRPQGPALYPVDILETTVNYTYDGAGL